ncbi:MAG: DinB family protein [Pyrinomonadaceae bacterium]|nr:DinB family protein [Pyrinomonadaceae bacterium]
MEIKTTLLKQFDRCFNGNGWFVAVRNAVDGIGVEQAAWKPNDAVNCIWETLSHLTYYNHAYLQRFKGIEFEYDVSDNNETFSTGEYTEQDWQADVARFDAVMTEWRQLIAAADESKFLEPVPTNTTRIWADLLADVNAHNAYHGGQILLLRKLAGNWNPNAGVS